MARTNLARQQVNRSGITPTFGAADNTNGMYFANSGKEVIEVKNAGAGACTVTITLAPGLSGAIDGGTVPAKTVVVPITTGDKIIGPFPPNLYNQADGTVYVDFSTGTSITVGCFQVA